MLYALGDIRPRINSDDVYVAPNASVIGECELGESSSVWFSCVLRGDTAPLTVGERSNIQDGSVLHADEGFPVVIGDGVTVGHKVLLHGCVIGDDSLVGMGATILNGAKIGKNCLIGANSLVTEGKTFPDGMLIMGSPAVVKRELKPQEIELIKLSAAHYVANAKRFKAELQQI